MSHERTRALLADFQLRFSAMLRTPLARETGTLRAQADAYDDALCSDVAAGAFPARARLAVYNRQYWLRLFSALQHDFPLTARLLGFWAFNDLAARFLEAQPPRSHDLADASQGFEHFLARVLDDARLCEAAQVDAAHGRVLRAPPEPRLVLGPDEASRLASLCLTPSAAAVVLQENWPLVALRKELHGADDERAVSPPAALSEPAHWAILRGDRGPRLLRLEAAQARLYALLAAHTVGDALAELEAETPHALRERLPARVQSWLATGMQHGLWTWARPASAEVGGR